MRCRWNSCAAQREETGAFLSRRRWPSQTCSRCCVRRIVQELPSLMLTHSNGTGCQLGLLAQHHHTATSRFTNTSPPLTAASPPLPRSCLPRRICRTRTRFPAAGRLGDPPRIFRYSRNTRARFSLRLLSCWLPALTALLDPLTRPCEMSAVPTSFDGALALRHRLDGTCNQQDLRLIFESSHAGPCSQPNTNSVRSGRPSCACWRTLSAGTCASGTSKSARSSRRTSGTTRQSLRLARSSVSRGNSLSRRYRLTIQTPGSLDGPLLLRYAIRHKHLRGEKPRARWPHAP